LSGITLLPYILEFAHLVRVPGSTKEFFVGPVGRSFPLSPHGKRNWAPLRPIGCSRLPLSLWRGIHCPLQSYDGPGIILMGHGKPVATCFLALLSLPPYFRKFGEFTVPVFYWRPLFIPITAPVWWPGYSCALNCLPLLMLAGPSMRGGGAWSSPGFLTGEDYQYGVKS